MLPPIFQTGWLHDKCISQPSLHLRFLWWCIHPAEWNIEAIEELFLILTTPRDRLLDNRALRWILRLHTRDAKAFLLISEMLQENLWQVRSIIYVISERKSTVPAPQAIQTKAGFLIYIRIHLIKIWYQWRSQRIVATKRRQKQKQNITQYWACAL